MPYTIFKTSQNWTKLKLESLSSVMNKELLAWL